LVIFGFNIFRGFRFAGGQIFHFPIDFAGHGYNSSVATLFIIIISEKVYVQGHVCSDELTSLCLEHYRAELEMQLSHQSSVYVMLGRLAETHRDSIMSALDSIHDRQVHQLKRNMDTGNKDEMKLLTAKHSDKRELARYSLL